MTSFPTTDSRNAIPMESAQIPIFRQYLDIFRRRIWIILSIAVVISCVGAVRAFRAPDVYSSSTRILIERQAPKVAFADPSATDFATWDPDFYSTQAQLLRSQPVLEMAVEDPEISRIIGQDSGTHARPLADRMKEIILAALGAPPQPVQEPWERLAPYITAKPVGGTHFLNISVTAHDPRTPALLANGVARAFETYIRKTRTDKLGDAFTYLKEEKEREEQKYLMAQEDLEAFREESKGLDLRDSESSPAIDKLSALNGHLTELQLKRAELKSQIVVIRDVVRNKMLDRDEKESRLLAVPIIKEDEGIQDARSRLMEQTAVIASLAQTYGEEHPLLLKAEATHATLQEEFNDTLQRAVLLHANRLQSLLTEEAEVTEQYEKQKNLALATAQESFKMARLEMEVDRHRQLFDALVKRMLEIEMSSGFDTTNVTIIEEARVSRTPIGPDRKRNIIFAICLGLGLGIGLAILIETMDDTIKTPEDLREKMDIPLLGFVPQVQPKTNEKIHSRINTLFAVDEPVSSIAEAFRQIRTNLFYSLATDSAKVVAATSCHPGEGKTTTICNLGAVIAQSGRRVLLIDGDFHRPHVHRIFGLEGTMGLADVLAGSVPWREAVITPHRNGIPLYNLDVIVAGHSTPTSSELLSSDAMSLFIKEARGKYDWVLVDSPPLLFVSDASVLSALCDGVILVVKSGMNNRSLLLKTRDHLRQLNVNILGTILNQMVVSLLGRHYSYYYYHGYSRYAEDYHNAYYGPVPGEDPQPTATEHKTTTSTSPTPAPKQAPALQAQLTTPPTERPAKPAPRKQAPPTIEQRRQSATPLAPPTQGVLIAPVPRVPPNQPVTTKPISIDPDDAIERREDIDRVKESLDDIEKQHAEILTRLQTILNRKPGERPGGMSAPSPRPPPS